MDTAKLRYPTTMDEIVARAKIAAQRGVHSGRIETPQDEAYFRACWHYFNGSRIIFSRDVGHHTSGWFKNPDSERCYHLSLSFNDPLTGEPAPYQKKKAEKWVRRFFGDNERLLWCEPPYTEKGKTLGVHHWRLFCDEHWQPIKPRGEVYTTHFTALGWKSWSEVKR